MSTGADPKTMPSTPEYEAGYERVFGKKEPERGKWVQHPITGELIPASEYQAPTPEAKNAPFMVGRFYENTAATDGTDIGSRRKHKNYMRDRGLTTADDYRQTWKKATEQREKVRRGEPGSLPSKTRRDVIARKLYEMHKP